MFLFKKSQSPEFIILKVLLFYQANNNIKTNKTEDDNTCNLNLAIICIIITNCSFMTSSNLLEYNFKLLNVIFEL